ncbi:hypothetical protein [Mycolicibacillus parakoreensis]|uniref:Integral membrane protein n=1 Tax=Mycolicibacillus parakoreensis TaxID=1069221 RepID=A0ABY3TWD1_9MYCO|nr:hypothetical protein [Mycolicibacillus parakoreensis]ULN52023.1 hypothetical protein MIU77_14265 [Mycolicibacillus parakoreensis]
MTVSTGDTDRAPQGEHRGRVPRWVNWVLALLTAPAAGMVVIVATGAVMSVAACSTVQCPDLGPSGLLFNVMYYGAPVVAAVTILLSFVTAAKRWGIAVPLTGWALLLADVAALAVTFNT